MTLPLDSHQQELLDLLGEVIAKIGLRRVPLVEPTAAFFPERYEPTLPSAGRLLHRLLSFAGVALEPEIVDGRRPTGAFVEGEFEVTRPVVSFIAIESGRAVFQVDQLGPGDLTAAELCQQVAYASLGAGGDPAQAAAATIVHGFGLITLPAATTMRRSSVVVGDRVITRQNLMLTGALPSGDLAFLLAAWLVLRGSDESERLERHLAEEPAANVAEWIQTLAPWRRELRERFELPWSGDRWIEPAVIYVSPPSDERLSAWQRAEDLYRRPNQGQSTARRWSKKTLDYAILGALLGLIATIACLVKDSPWSLAWLPIAVGLVGGARMGRRARRYYCGACHLLLRPRDERCAKCGVTFERDEAVVSKISEMPDDPEDDELTREALAATPVDEADSNVG